MFGLLKAPLNLVGNMIPGPVRGLFASGSKALPKEVIEEPVKTLQMSLLQRVGLGGVKELTIASIITTIVMNHSDKIIEKGFEIAKAPFNFVLDRTIHRKRWKAEQQEVRTVESLQGEVDILRSQVAALRDRIGAEPAFAGRQSSKPNPYGNAAYRSTGLRI